MQVPSIDVGLDVTPAHFAGDPAFAALYGRYTSGTSATPPPAVVLGERYFDTVNKREWLWDGAAWNVTYGPVWTALTFTTTAGTRVWENYDAATFLSGEYCKLGSMVWVRGLLLDRLSAMTAGDPVATLPVGHRPLKVVISGNYSSAGVLDVRVAPTGVISVTPAVANGVWLAIDLMFATN